VQGCLERQHAAQQPWVLGLDQRIQQLCPYSYRCVEEAVNKALNKAFFDIFQVAAIALV
jgi:hypothetical protein